jgi:hypothetical protein
MPATAAKDNETLDHLLSVVDDAANVVRRNRISKPDFSPLPGSIRGNLLKFQSPRFDSSRILLLQPGPFRG